ncbi:MAG TPA: arginine deiminase-related protein [Galbitalea sp.]|jgi:dimethylargininase|nr:arginine deiminase-related protein [Galbitalea sp.]
MKQTSFARRLLASLAAGIATGLVVFLTVSLAYYVASDASALAILEQFASSAVVLIVVVLVASLLGATATWPRALTAGIVAGITAPYFGVVILLSLRGGEFTASSDAAFQDLLTFNLIFFVVTVLAGLTLTRRIYAWAFGLRVVAPPEVHRVALVRAPATTLAKGELTHLKRKPVKYQKAQDQWDAYVAALESEGFRVQRVDADDAYPDCVFIEDMVVMLGQIAVVTSPGAESRKGETDAVEAAVLDLGLETRHIRLPGTLDGGDVLKVGKTIYVGKSSRTNSEGIRQFRAIAIELGYEVVGVPATKALHLKSSVTALPDGTVIGHGALVERPSIFERYLEVPEVEGVAVVVLTNNSVLMSASAPKSAALIADLGYRVTTVEIGEFEKLEGCVTCLSVRIR